MYLLYRVTPQTTRSWGAICNVYYEDRLSRHAPLASSRTKFSNSPLFLNAYHAFYNPGQNSLGFSMYFVISRHTTIISNGNKVSLSPPPVQSWFGLKAHVGISGVTANKIGIGEGGTVFHFAMVSFLVRTSAKNRYFVIGFNSFCPRLYRATCKNSNLVIFFSQVLFLLL